MVGWAMQASTRGMLAPQRALVWAIVAVLVGALSGCSTATGSSTPSAHAASAFRHYVALGDSFTAAPLVPVTDVANGCFRSSANYPALVAQALRTKLDDRSCGGATTDDFTRSQYPGVPPQFSALNAETDLVTLSIGGNDQRVFARLVGRCPALRSQDPGGSPCRRSMGARGRDALLTAIRTARPRIVAAVKDVERRAPNARLLVVGYPQIAAADHACAALPLATGDYAYAVQVNQALTETMRRAAQATGATYVDVWRASGGHDICSADPWVNGAVTDQKRAARYHPFAEEQRAVAKLVLAALRPGA